MKIAVIGIAGFAPGLTELVAKLNASGVVDGELVVYENIEEATADGAALHLLGTDNEREERMKKWKEEMEYLAAKHTAYAEELKPSKQEQRWKKQEQRNRSNYHSKNFKKR